MTDLAERTTGSTLVDETTRAPTPERTPPDRRPPVMPSATAPWPSRAKLLVAVLAVVALLGVAGTFIGFTSGDDGPTATEQEMQTTIDELTTERDVLAGQVTEFDTSITTLTAERDELLAEMASLEGTVDAAASDREALVDQVTELDLTIAALTTERDGLADRVTGYESNVAELRVELADASEQVSRYESMVAELRADVARETARATTAESERNVLADLFPITFDASLDGVAVSDLAGTYDVSFTEAYCSGFDSCGTKLVADEITLTATTEGYLQVEIDDIVDAGLYRVDGALYAVAQSTPDVADCGSTPRVARVAVTVFAHGISVADDGTHQVTDLGATLTIQSEPAATCGSGLAFYGTELAPQA